MCTMSYIDNACMDGYVCVCIYFLIMKFLINIVCLMIVDVDECVSGRHTCGVANGSRCSSEYVCMACFV